MAKRKSTKSPTDSELDALWEQFAQSPAHLSEKDVYLAEKVWQEGLLTFHRSRRATLAVLSRSGQQLVDAGSGDREGALAFAHLYEVLEDQICQLKALVALMGSARARIAMALVSREDMRELLQEAKRGTA